MQAPGRDDPPDRHDVYIQSIDDPTVARGTKRPLTPTPPHDDARMDRLVDALVDMWRTLEVTARLAPEESGDDGPASGHRRRTAHGPPQRQDIHTFPRQGRGTV